MKNGDKSHMVTVQIVIERWVQILSGFGPKDQRLHLPRYGPNDYKICFVQGISNNTVNLCFCALLFRRNAEVFLSNHFGCEKI